MLSPFVPFQLFFEQQQDEDQQQYSCHGSGDPKSLQDLPNLLRAGSSGA